MSSMLPKTSSDDDDSTSDKDSWYETGLQFYKNCNFDQAVAYFQMSASRGCKEAQFSLGSSFMHGTGVPVSYKKAKPLLEQAAKQGHPLAQYNLAHLYFNGKGVKKDVKLAAMWIRRAADTGHPLSQVRMAVMYYYGDGVPRDSDKALFWFTKAAEQGDEGARVMVATTALINKQCYNEEEVNHIVRMAKKAARSKVNADTMKIAQSVLAVLATLEDISKCASCKITITETHLFKCSGCRQERYCSKDCQRQDWKRHKLNCRKLGDDNDEEEDEREKEEENNLDDSRFIVK